MYEAEFTSDSGGQVICQRCKISFEAGTKLSYMHSTDPTRHGRHICDGCHEYYLQKQTTRRRQDNGTLPQSSGAQSVIRQVAAAQRGESGAPIVPVGNSIMHALTPLSSSGGRSRSGQDFTSSHSHILPPIPERQERISRINIPPMPNIYSAAPFPRSMNSPLVNPGYQEAHQLYNEMRCHFANKAFSTVANAEVIVVKVWMMTRLPGKKSPVTISDIFEALSNIPVHIGVQELKFIAYHALLPQYIKWSKNFSLTFEGCELRNKQWVEFVPKHPDIDAVADKFFDCKGRNKTLKVFSASLRQGIEIYLVITLWALAYLSARFIWNKL